MSRYPHTRLYVPNSQCVVVLSGPHIQVLDPQNGRILHSTTNFVQEDQNLLVRAGPVRCSGLSRDAKYLATSADDKRLKIWDIESLTLVSSRELPKKPTSIEFTSDTDILVSDKFGDVFRYALHPKCKPAKEKGSGDKLASHENPSDGELILGHASLLTTCLLTPDEKFIITADRDEHIRVSWYPEGYVIESYCLGHKKYVSAIHIPSSSPLRLISGGGDPELNVWDWMTGRLERSISVLSTVEPFIKVAPSSKGNDLSDEIEEESVKLSNFRSNTNDSGDPESQKLPDKTSNTIATVLVIRRISSFTSEGVTHVVFSVVGATAIFEFILAEEMDQPKIRYYEFGKPVIDFTLSPEGLIWALIDADFFVESQVSGSRLRDLVQVIQWSGIHQSFVDAGNPVLLDTLNRVCSLPATVDDLKAVDLYSDLCFLPKSIDGEQEIHGSEKMRSGQPTGDECEVTSAHAGLTKRALGRLKHKRALGQLHHERTDDHAVPGPNGKRMKVSPDDHESHVDATAVELTV